MKYIEWKDVVEIKVISNKLTKWIYISKVHLNYDSLSMYRLKRNYVYIVETGDIINIIRKYVPEQEKYKM